MYKDVLRSIEGIGLYPVISLVVFTVFFTTVFLWIFFMRKDHAAHMADLPLKDGTRKSTESGESRHG